jgi:large subunit ribosomal protein L16
MLSPRKVKYRKQMKLMSHLRGKETRGCKLSFGKFGLYAVESGHITARQIEAARVAISRHAKRGVKVWIRVFPDKPITRKPAETRMGSGKGSPEYFVAEVRAGRIMYELTGVDSAVAREALKRASAKLPVKCKIVERVDSLL